jgi:HEAT repeat protein
MIRVHVPALALLALLAAGCSSIQPDAESVDPDSRRRAAEMLAGEGDAVSVAQLRRLLADTHTACPSHPHVRGAAVRSLGLTGLADVLPDLVATLEKDPDVQVRADAAAALGDLGLPAAAPPLRAALLRVPRAPEKAADKPPAKAGEAPAGNAPVAAAAKPAAPDGVAGEAVEVRRAAARSLGRLRDAGSRDALIQALSDPEKTVRSVARDALATITGADKGDDPAAWK